MNARVHLMHVLDTVTQDAFTSGAAKPLRAMLAHVSTEQQKTQQKTWCERVQLSGNGSPPHAQCS